MTNRKIWEDIVFAVLGFAVGISMFPLILIGAASIRMIGSALRSWGLL